MPKKILKAGPVAVFGTIDLSQFWPHAGQPKSRFDSDADTVKVKVDPKAGFTFDGKPTDAFDDAGLWHRDKKKNLVFKPVVTKAGILTVRLQGIDAPEMHFQSYKQHMGESCTVELKKFLKPHASQGTLTCHVFTRNIKEPNDVFDVYGRFVGDIEIRLKGGGWRNLNQWLIENGNAYPSFYESMDGEEIRKLRLLSAKAQHPNKNARIFYVDRLDAMDRKLKHKSADTYDAKADRMKPVVNPKLFRRLYAFEITNKKTFTASAFRDDLIERASKSNDYYFVTNEFLAKGPNAIKHKLGEVVAATGNVRRRPDTLVFTEKPTHLTNSKHGKPVFNGV